MRAINFPRFFGAQITGGARATDDKKTAGANQRDERSNQHSSLGHVWYSFGAGGTGVKKARVKPGTTRYRTIKR